MSLPETKDCVKTLVHFSCTCPARWLLTLTSSIAAGQVVLLQRAEVPHLSTQRFDSLACENFPAAQLAYWSNVGSLLTSISSLTKFIRYGDAIIMTNKPATAPRDINDRQEVGRRDRRSISMVCLNDGYCPDAITIMNLLSTSCSTPAEIPSSTSRQ